MLNYRFITEIENMKNFNPFEDMEKLSQTEDTFIVRTWKLLPTLQFMQNSGWKLQELIPDDDKEKEFNILIFKKWVTNT